MAASARVSAAASTMSPRRPAAPISLQVGSLPVVVALFCLSVGAKLPMMLWIGGAVTTAGTQSRQVGRYGGETTDADEGPSLQVGPGWVGIGHLRTKAHLSDSPLSAASGAARLLEWPRFVWGRSFRYSALRVAHSMVEKAKGYLFIVLYCTVKAQREKGTSPGALSPFPSDPGSCPPQLDNALVAGYSPCTAGAIALLTLCQHPAPALRPDA